MKLFSYNEDSILNNSFVRGVNYIILWLIIFCGLDGVEISLSFKMLIAIAIVSAIVTSLILHKVLKTSFNK